MTNLIYSQMILIEQNIRFQGIAHVFFFVFDLEFPKILFLLFENLLNVGSPLVSFWTLTEIKLLFRDSKSVSEYQDPLPYNITKINLVSAFICELLVYYIDRTSFYNFKKTDFFCNFSSFWARYPNIDSSRSHWLRKDVHWIIDKLFWRKNYGLNGFETFISHFCLFWFLPVFVVIVFIIKGLIVTSYWWRIDDKQPCLPM